MTIARTTTQSTSSQRGDARDSELLRLASCIADGMPLGAEASGDIGADESGSFGLLDRVAQGFRRALSNADVPAAAPCFRFAGLDVFTKLAEGSYGEVWHAHDPMLGLPVALKLLKPESGLLAATFLDEARHLARLRHPNILNVFGAAVDDGRTGLWSELVHGVTLHDVVARGQRLDAAEVRAIGRELCSALAYIHRQQLVHGDVKPGNIMREDSGRIVLMDFGATRCFTAPSGDDALHGSMRYLAPEVLQGAPRTPATDIYALGVTLHVLLTGAYPREAGAAGNVVSLDKQIPRDLRRAIQTALHADPSRRHADARAFSAALDAASARPAPVRIAVFLASLALLGSALALRETTRAPAWTASSAFLQAAEQGYRPLNDGTPLRMGDTFALEFQTSRPTWLYVLDDDGAADPAVLFPADELTTRNPIGASAAARLPGPSITGEGRDWQVNTDAKVERIMVIASPERLQKLETAIAHWQHASGAAAVATRADGDRRGAYGLAPSRQPSSASGSAIRAAVGDLDALRAAGKVRVWEVTFPRTDAPRG